MKAPPHPPGKHVVAFLLASVAALFARAWLQIELTNAGYDARLANELAYFVVPPILLLLLFPVLLKDRAFLRAQFRREDLSIRVVMIAIALGLLVRIAWHGHVVAGTAFGFYAPGPVTVGPPAIAYDCPAARLILLSILVTSVLIPVIEEVLHRGYVQTWAGRFGAVAAISISTVLFVVFHKSSGWIVVALGGAVLGICFWLTASLWLPVILHAVLNLLPQLTLRCLDVRWTPDTRASQTLLVGMTAVSVSIAAFVGIVALVAILGRRRAAASPAPCASQRVRNTLDDV